MSIALRSHVFTQTTPTRVGRFYFHGAVYVDAVAPTSGPLGGGTVLDVRGAGFIRSSMFTLCGLRQTVNGEVKVTRVSQAMYVQTHVALYSRCCCFPLTMRMAFIRVVLKHDRQ